MSQQRSQQSRFGREAAVAGSRRPTNRWSRPEMYRAVVELQAPPSLLDSPRAIEQLVHDVVDTFDLNLMSYDDTPFTPIGVTAFGILGESHISVHTWPERAYAHVELLTCVPLPDAVALRSRFPLPNHLLVEVRRCEP